MKIAVSTNGNSLKSQVSEKLESCKYLLIVNMDDLSFVSIENSDDNTGEKLANEVLKYDCEAIITGELKPSEFDILADACVTRYIGVGYSADTALDLMDKRILKLIRNYEGTDECDGSHHHVH
ncbi:NifB/NifX family molybdenum-iron cluster-binding protein [Anaerovorax odorimutans]|uniref:NifB/NifX family molybdenum-iron cluster-binding protein n=1 Tax=Anaerovorax odorimutans TaxID=109327 RepID=UPI00040C353F|nr:NifB/NifX family molybdenum-iron cluster-binding protein [Anaerovorax odorimutans]